VFTLALVFLLYCVNVNVLAQDGSEEFFVTNVRVERQGRINIFIEYDLSGSPDDMYTISLAVRSKSDSTYSYTPLNVIGDVGPNIRTGKNRRISWRISDEYPAILSSADARFVIKAIPPKSSGGNTELFIAGGAAVVGVALAIVLLSSNKAGPGQFNNVFPEPPGRP
ncbi:MAG: hypothetical protein ABI623_03940, partial [bacterium]